MRSAPTRALFSIGCNVNNHANNIFLGLIDWITWQDVVDYSGVDATSMQ
jgi:hypothetical protein